MDLAMARVTFVADDGEIFAVTARNGTTVMEAAVRNGVPGIAAACGGTCACATCHVHVDPVWLERTGGRNEMEDAIIEISNDVRPNSRLSCQMRVTEALDGLIVHIPPGQH